MFFYIHQVFYSCVQQKKITHKVGHWNTKALLLEFYHILY